jgi:hypothetical protein
MKASRVLAMIPDDDDPVRLRAAILKIDAVLAVEVERLRVLKKRKAAAVEIEVSRAAEAMDARRSIYMLDSAHNELWNRMTAAETQRTRARDQTPKPLRKWRRPPNP